jgi:hypothetical protein
MKPIAALLASLLIAVPAFAQAPRPDAPKGERREAVRQAHEKARKACEGKAGDEARECMRREMCAQSKDPAACESRAKARAERRAKMQEACKGKTGEELKTCIREQRSKTTKK